MDIVIPDDVLSRELDGEAVLLDLQTGRYFGLNATGARVWASLAEGLDRAAIVERIMSEFEVDADRAEHDVRTFIDALVDRGLLKIKTAL